jgi:hypothetical protein
MNETQPIDQKHPFLWIGILGLASAIGLTRLNIYLGTQVNYLDHLLFFNALTIGILSCAAITIILSLAGLWKTRFKSIPLVLVSLVSFAFLILLFLID